MMRWAGSLMVTATVLGLVSGAAATEETSGRPWHGDSSTADRIERTVEWVVLHLAAHALLAEADGSVPNGSDEEAFYDAFASTRLGSGEPDDAERARRLLQVAEVINDIDTGDGATVLRDHPADQRSFRIACVAEQTDPKVVGPFAEWAEYGDGWQDRCSGLVDRDVATENWDVVLSNIALFEDEPASEFVIEIQDASEFGDFTRFLRESRVMENTLRPLAEGFAFADPLTITVQSCGVGVTAGENDGLTLCFETLAGIDEAVRRSATGTSE